MPLGNSGSNSEAGIFSFLGLGNFADFVISTPGNLVCVAGSGVTGGCSPRPFKLSLNSP